MPQTNNLNQEVAIQKSIIGDIKKTQEEHGKTIHDIDKRTMFVQNEVAHINTNLGDLITHLKEVHKNHETRITVLEQHDIVTNHQKLDTRVITLEKTVSRIIYLIWGSLATASSALVIGLSANWYKLTQLFHG